LAQAAAASTSSSNAGAPPNAVTPISPRCLVISLPSSNILREKWPPPILAALCYPSRSGPRRFSPMLTFIILTSSVPHPPLVSAAPPLLASQTRPLTPATPTYQRARSHERSGVNDRLRRDHCPPHQQSNWKQGDQRRALERLSCIPQYV